MTVSRCVASWSISDIHNQTLTDADIKHEDERMSSDWWRENTLLLMANSACAVLYKCILKYTRVYRAGRAGLGVGVGPIFRSESVSLQRVKVTLLNIHGKLSGLSSGYTSKMHIIRGNALRSNFSDLFLLWTSHREIQNALNVCCFSSCLNHLVQSRFQRSAGIS